MWVDTKVNIIKKRREYSRRLKYNYELLSIRSGNRKKA